MWTLGEGFFGNLTSAAKKKRGSFRGKGFLRTSQTLLMGVRSFTDKATNSRRDGGDRRRRRHPSNSRSRTSRVCRQRSVKTRQISKLLRLRQIKPRTICADSRTFITVGLSPSRI